MPNQAIPHRNQIDNKNKSKSMIAMPSPINIDAKSSMPMPSQAMPVHINKIDSKAIEPVLNQPTRRYNNEIMQFQIKQIESNSTINLKRGIMAGSNTPWAQSPAIWGGQHRRKDDPHLTGDWPLGALTKPKTTKRRCCYNLGMENGINSPSRGN